MRDGQPDLPSVDRRNNPVHVRQAHFQPTAIDDLNVRWGQQGLSSVDRVENPLHERRDHFEPSSIKAETTNLNLSAFSNVIMGLKGLFSMDRENPLHMKRALYESTCVYNTNDAIPNTKNYQQDYFSANQNQKRPTTRRSFYELKSTPEYFNDQDYCEQIPSVYNCNYEQPKIPQFNTETRGVEFPRGLMDAIKTIPKYISHADMLPVFFQSILNVRDAFGSESEPWNFNSLTYKLKGLTATDFASRLTQYKNIESLLSDLKSQYWGRESADIHEKKLQAVKQDATESTASFVLRVQSLPNSLMSAFDQDSPISESHRKVLKEIAIKEACEQFLCALRPELEATTLVKQPKIVSMAIDAAVLSCP